MNSEAGRRYFTSAQIGGGQKNVNASALKAMPVLLPGRAGEQDAIAEAVGDADANILSDMDVEIAAIEARLAKTRELKQGMAQALLTGRVRLMSPAESARP